MVSTKLFGLSGPGGDRPDPNYFFLPIFTANDLSLGTSPLSPTPAMGSHLTSNSRYVLINAMSGVVSPAASFDDMPCHAIQRDLRSSFGIYLFGKFADQSTLATANSPITIDMRSLTTT